MTKILIFLLVFNISCSSKVSENIDIRDIEIFKKSSVWELAKSISNDDINKVEEILRESHIDINYKDPIYGFTLLMWSVKMNKYNIVEILLKYGADPNIQSNLGSTALFLSTQFSWTDTKAQKESLLVKLLLSYGADPNIVYTGDVNSTINRGTSPLIHASSRSLEKVKALVNGGAKINYKTELNMSAAINALLNEEVDIAHYLIVEKKAIITEPYFFYHLGTDSINYKDKRLPVDLLRNWVFELGTEKYKKKMEIVEAFYKQEVDYMQTVIHPRVLERIKILYPNSWKAYIKEY
jgi:hypothetical protein